MPHIAIEYTRNLAGRLNIANLIDVLHSTAQRMGVFPHWGIRTFATVIEEARIADDGVGGVNGYVHVRVKVAAGRDEATIHQIVNELYSALGEALEQVCATKPVGFQLEVYEFNPLTTRSGGSIAGAPTAEA